MNCSMFDSHVTLMTRQMKFKSTRDSNHIINMRQTPDFPSSINVSDKTPPTIFSTDAAVEIYQMHGRVETGNIVRLITGREPLRGVTGIGSSLQHPAHRSSKLTLVQISPPLHARCAIAPAGQCCAKMIFVCPQE
ncbi:hypothetical protein MRB53_039570 [Persea americana]|nr:hypothetical protein MRB53_039570 [Persea americana]